MAATSSLSFNLSLSLTNLTTSKTKLFGPRLGTISLRRTGPDTSNESKTITLATPTFITTTSRGIVPHLSRDNLRRTPAVRWINVPFETFLEHDPPVPTLYPDSFQDPLHTFLGFDPGNQIVSLSARDPDNVQETPPNGNAILSVWTLRGVRKLTPSNWRAYTLKCQPDIVFALCDTPFTDPVNHAYSQKRLTKSIERTTAWLGVMLRPWLSATENENAKKAKGKGSKADPSASSNSQPPSNTTHFSVPNPNSNAQAPLPNLDSPPPPLPPIFLPMAGGSSLGARRAFACSLLEPFYGAEAEAMKYRGIKTLDEGIVGYSFDLAPLRGEAAVPEGQNGSTPKGVVEGGDVEAKPSLPTPVDPILQIQTSLSPLTSSKPRLINSTKGPHEILRYITQVGVDVFDATWAQNLAGWGVGLDFEFPVRKCQREGGRSIGHNLYAETYAFDCGSIADAFRGVFTAASQNDDRPICACATCSPLSPFDQDQIRHGVDSPEYTLVPDHSALTMQKYYHTRAYIHHLLQTHEMSAHTLLAMHNLTVLDRFFEGIREVLGSLAPLSSSEKEDGEDGRWKEWTEEVDRFCQNYDETMSREVFERARVDWRDVDRARGKGRLAREREKEAEVLN